jgi:dTDP-4-dehydrorhamnose 3,5-epimerase
MKWSEGEIEGVVLRKAVKHSDQRGWLTEIFRSDEAPADLMPAMSYVSVTKPGVSRGPHGHKDQTDVFAFVGPGTFRIKLWDNRPTSGSYGRMTIATVGEDNPMIVVVPPGVAHGYTNISKQDAMVLNYPNRLYAGKSKKLPVDEIRYENEKDCDFLMD